MKNTVVTIIAIVAAFSISATVKACYIPMTNEQLVAQSCLVVGGKITEVVEGGRGERDKSTATLTVTEVLKGDKSIETVKLCFPARNRPMVASTDIFYKKGQEGIWLLRRLENEDYYLADHPARFQPIEKLEEIRTVVNKQKGDQASGLDPWKKRIIDQWIKDNDLNRYGDPKGTGYMGGTPLFDEKAGRRIDRYDYIYMKHPEVRKLLAEKAKGRHSPENE